MSLPQPALPDDDDLPLSALNDWLYCERGMSIPRVICPSETEQLGGLTPPRSPDDIRNEVPFPVEYKRGKRKWWDNDDVPLCAQALCLEEILGVSVPRGAIFHIKSKRRREVIFTDKLRIKTEATAARLQELIAAGVTPPPVLKPQSRRVREVFGTHQRDDHEWRTATRKTGVFRGLHTPYLTTPTRLAAHQWSHGFGHFRGRVLLSWREPMKRKHVTAVAWSSGNGRNTPAKSVGVELRKNTIDSSSVLVIAVDPVRSLSSRIASNCF